jgi:uncharacterized protein (DUF362 family)
VNRQAFNPQVALAELLSPVYSDASRDTVSQAIARAADQLEWSAKETGPFGNIIPRGARVLVKPNLVLHENRAPYGIEPLVTHPSLIRAAVEAALTAGAGEVMVGDAPIQGCDFDHLLSATGLDRWAEELMKREPRFKGVKDFRRTTCTFRNGVRVASENLQAEDRFILFDLGQNSLLEPITDDRSSFRVTCYDPSLMAKTHAPGRHQYLVAREVIEADVIINLPKLKTHKKAGVTCALKNLIGINGNKEYLPHHRVGGSETGGDCYAGGSLLKRTLEYIADQRNSTASHAAGLLWTGLTVPIYQMLRLTKESTDTEGAWSGNDTIWRTCLDLNRILLYGRADATLAGDIQRRVIHIADAVIAGQGDGPLAPEPLPLGLILAGNNATAVDYVGAHLLGYAPEKIPIVDRAFQQSQWPLTLFTQDEVELVGDWGSGTARELIVAKKLDPILHPAGWRNAAMTSV